MHKKTQKKKRKIAIIIKQPNTLCANDFKMQPNICKNMESQVSSAFQARPLPCDDIELCIVGILWPSHRQRGQHFGFHYQWCGICHRSYLYRHIRHILRLAKTSKFNSFDPIFQNRHSLASKMFVYLLCLVPFHHNWFKIL